MRLEPAALVAATIVGVALLLPLLPRLLPERVRLPAILYSSLIAVGTIPYLVLLAFDQSYVKPEVSMSGAIGSLGTQLVWFAVVFGIGHLSYSVGIMRPASRRPGEVLRPYLEGESSEALVLVAWLAFGVAILLFLKFLADIGGFAYLLANLHRRVEFTAGRGYFLNALGMLTISLSCLLIAFGRSRSLILFVQCLAVFLVAVVVYSSLGGRKYTLQMVIVAGLVWHLRVQPIKRPLRMMLIAAVLILPYFVGLRLLREKGAVEYFLQRPGELGSAMVENAAIAVTELSYVDQYVFITSHFGVTDFLLGSGFAPLATAAVPSSIMSAKPPVDDGRYIRSRVAGERPGILEPVSHFYHSSWPPESLGMGYVNFGLVGVAIFLMLLGVVHAETWVLVKSAPSSVFPVLLYSQALLGFHVSVLRIAQTLTYLGILCACWGVMRLVDGCRGVSKGRMARKV